MIETRALLALLPVILAFALAWEYTHATDAGDHNQHNHTRECILRTQECSFDPRDLARERGDI